MLCVHGKYVGTPGGPDHMCPLCEDGKFSRGIAPVWTVWFVYQGKREKIETIFSPFKLAQRIRLMDDFGATPYYEIEQGVYEIWR